ncbi:hypothetical protein GJ496_001867 [Pomphorhynchus laevis]|nr:hypothetical protein GJ496_010052 [Pomphorhynchus laevis]KAI0985560.1 hypothetical protein GJ496_001867 [Pomphorhynchus laevis]
MQNARQEEAMTIWLLSINVEMQNAKHGPTAVGIHILPLLAICVLMSLYLSNRLANAKPIKRKSATQTRHPPRTDMRQQSIKGE